MKSKSIEKQTETLEEVSSYTELAGKLKVTLGCVAMTIFGIGTSWASGLVPILH